MSVALVRSEKAWFLVIRSSEMKIAMWRML